MSCNFICKFGIAAAYQGVYLANILFPIVFASTTFGVCCMMGSISGFFSSGVYSIDGTVPWFIFTALSTIGIICALMLREK